MKAGDASIRAAKLPCDRPVAFTNSAKREPRPSRPPMVVILFSLEYRSCSIENNSCSRSQDNYHVETGHVAVMDSMEITYRLKRLGWSQSDLAREFGITQSVVSNTISGRITCHRVATFIADLLGKNLHDLWPGRYVFKPRRPRYQPAGVLPMTT
ncbi:helix-turn-helix domain-containing protein [Hydrocarboniphaga effusa]